MPVPNPIIIINGVSLSSSQINAYKVSYSKLWKDAGRDMAGRLKATLIGVYPNIDLTTSVLNFDLAMSISSAVNDDFFSVSYWDTQTSSMKTASFYAADHDVSLLNECQYGQVQLQLVPVQKANYI